MRILLSAFSCGPGRGSEAGVGWNWALEAARLGHEVTVVTTTEFRALHEAQIASGKLPPNLRIDLFTPAWLETLRDLGLRTRFQSLTWLLTSIAWQLLLPRHVLRAYPRLPFDLVHHVTLATIRHPTCLGRLGPPLVLGPIGGGERCPGRLRRGLSVTDRVTEGIRDLHTWLLRFDPISRRAFAEARLILVRTRETKAVLPAAAHRKTVYSLGVGVRGPRSQRVASRRGGEPLRLIFAGRLLSWKGLHLGLEALALARAGGADIRLTIAGEGPQRLQLERQAGRLGLAEAVRWTGLIPQRELMALYRSHHALLFPSLHDSGGMAVLEGLANGLPVICLALGGPALIVHESCGRVVPDTGRPADVARRLAEAIDELARCEELRVRLARGAIERAAEFDWSTLVAASYRTIAAELGLDGAAPAAVRPAAGRRPDPKVAPTHVPCR